MAKLPISRVPSTARRRIVAVDGWQTKLVKRYKLIIMRIWRNWQFITERCRGQLKRGYKGVAVEILQVCTCIKFRAPQESRGCAAAIYPIHILKI